MHRHAKNTVVIERAILLALGERAADFDVEAIAGETHDFRIDIDEQGRELRNAAGFEQAVDDDEFSAITARHTR